MLSLKQQLATSNLWNSDEAEERLPNKLGNIWEESMEKSIILHRSGESGFPFFELNENKQTQQGNGFRNISKAFPNKNLD